MKKVLMMLALVWGTITVNAQESNGDLFEGLTRKLTFDHMIPPHSLEDRKSVV